jgi:5-methylcytosine-specific restriction endonuclease McrA
MPEKDGEPGTQVSQFIIEVSEQEIRREKDKARELRRTRWWKNRVAQGVCHYCGRKFPPEELTMDHIVPIARGGKSTRGNVAPACRECNSRKKYLLPIEWEDYLQSMGKDE